MDYNTKKDLKDKVNAIFVKTGKQTLLEHSTLEDSKVEDEWDVMTKKMSLIMRRGRCKRIFSKYLRSNFLEDSCDEEDDIEERKSNQWTYATTLDYISSLN